MPVLTPSWEAYTSQTTTSERVRNATYFFVGVLFTKLPRRYEDHDSRRNPLRVLTTSNPMRTISAFNLEMDLSRFSLADQMCAADGPIVCWLFVFRPSSVHLCRYRGSHCVWDSRRQLYWNYIPFHRRWFEWLMPSMVDAILEGENDCHGRRVSRSYVELSSKMSVPKRVLLTASCQEWLMHNFHGFIAKTLA